VTKLFLIGEPDLNATPNQRNAACLQLQLVFPPLPLMVPWSKVSCVRETDDIGTGAQLGNPVRHHLSRLQVLLLELQVPLASTTSPIITDRIQDQNAAGTTSIGP
jgi:hypothetical protein